MPEEKQKRIEQIRDGAIGDDANNWYRRQAFPVVEARKDIDFLLSLVKEQEAGDFFLASCEEDIKAAIFKVISQSDQWLFYHPKEAQSQRADFANQVISLLRRNRPRRGPESLLRLQQVISRIVAMADTGSAGEFGDAMERLRLICEMGQIDSVEAGLESLSIEKQEG